MQALAGLIMGAMKPISSSAKGPSFADCRQAIEDSLDSIREILDTTPQIMSEIEAAIEAKDVDKFYDAVGRLYVGFTKEDIIKFRYIIAGEEPVDFERDDLKARMRKAKHIAALKIKGLEKLQDVYGLLVKKFAH